MMSVTVNTHRFPSVVREALDVDNCTFVEVRQHDQVSNHIASHVAEHVSQSFGWCVKGEEIIDKHAVPKAGLNMGQGLHKVPVGKTGKFVHVLRIGVGEPVGTGCGPAELVKTYILAEGLGKASQELILAFIDEVLAATVKKDEDSISVYSWDFNSMWWQMVTRPKRSLDSIFLPEGVKEMIVDDLTDFLEAKDWFRKHGISYKRNVLLYGPPGTGKSSLIQALAGHLNRSCCFMQPSNPQMNDDNFKNALDRVPANSIIVLEDIDSLFGKNREKVNSSCPLTFSGFLNGLDGLSAPTGQIFILTTNHPERLDPAVMRAGRVDVKVELPSCTRVQLYDMFLSFYPGEVKCANRFADALASSSELSMADIQNHFITHRKSSAEQASANVDVEEILGVRHMRKYFEKKDEEKKKAEENKNAEAEKKEDEKKEDVEQKTTDEEGDADEVAEIKNTPISPMIGVKTAKKAAPMV